MLSCRQRTPCVARCTVQIQAMDYWCLLFGKRINCMYRRTPFLHEYVETPKRKAAVNNFFALFPLTLCLAALVWIELVVPLFLRATYVHSLIRLLPCGTFLFPSAQMMSLFRFAESHHFLFRESAMSLSFISRFDLFTFIH